MKIIALTFLSKQLRVALIASIIMFIITIPLVAGEVDIQQEGSEITFWAYNRESAPTIKISKENIICVQAQMQLLGAKTYIYKASLAPGTYQVQIDTDIKTFTVEDTSTLTIAIFKNGEPFNAKIELYKGGVLQYTMFTLNGVGVQEVQNGDYMVLVSDKWFSISIEGNTQEVFELPAMYDIPFIGPVEKGIIFALIATIIIIAIFVIYLRRPATKKMIG